MNRHAWIAVGLAILVIGCGGAGGGGSTSSLPGGSSGGSTGLTTSTGGSGSTTGTTGSTSTTGTTSTTGSTDSSTTGGATSTDGSTTGSTDGTITIVATDDSGSSTSGTTTGSTDGSTTGTTTGSTDGSTTGTSGSTTGTTTGGSTGTTGSSGSWADQFSSVTVKLYEVDLLSSGGYVVAFSDPAGTDVDVKQLSDNNGAKFQFLNNTVIPFGTYTGVRLILSPNFTAVLSSNNQTLNEQFSPTYTDAAGHTVLTYNFASPVTVGTGGATFAIDFALGDWYEQGGYIFPTVGEGSTVGIDDPTKQVTSRSVGFVKNLVDGVSFDLKHGSHDLHVVLGPGTVITGGTLKNSKHVFVYAVWNQSNKTLIATKVQIK